MKSTSLCIILSSLLLTACASTSNRYLGADARLSPGLKKFTQSASNAVKDPHAWVPLIGAASFEEDNAFPSGHTSGAAIAARLAARNIQYVGINENQKKLWQVMTYTTAALTGWARVEGNRHYPSDVLVGYALGNFLGAFLHDTFIAPYGYKKVTFNVSVTGRGDPEISFSYRF